MNKITESPSHYDHLETLSVNEILTDINREDHVIADAVQKAIPQIEAFVCEAEKRLKAGGRMFYLGAGTSGRLGVLDASELPPTYGVSERLVTGLIAGGDRALRHAVENAEDNPEQGWIEIQAYNLNHNDIILGIAASGTTPYVVGAIKHAKAEGLLTGCITSNPNTPLAQSAEYPIEVLVGPEFVTGSSRMKSGTAHKMILNMISTTLMIRLGRVAGNRMVNMQLTNQKLIERGTKMIMQELNIAEDEARKLLLEKGSVKAVLEQHI